jgi:hypothetical protein
VAGDMRVSLLLEANAAQAKAEVASVRKELTGLSTDAIAAGRAGAASAEGTARAAQAQAEWGSIVQMARAELQPMVGEYYGLVAAIQQVATAEEMGALTTREAALAHDLLARQANELMARMQAAGVTVDGTTAALQRHETAVQQLIAQNTGLSRATEGTIADTLRHGLALDSLRAKYNPLFAASRQYEQELRDIAEAERLGAISAMEAANARERAAQAMAPIPGQLGGIRSASRGAASGLQNIGLVAGQVGYQLQDVLVSGPTIGWLRAVAQQAPQAAGAFSLLGGRLAAWAPWIGAAIAVGAALAPMFLDWGEAAGEAAERVSALADAQKALVEAGRASQVDIDKLRLGVDEEYQVELLREQIRLRGEIEAKAAEQRQTAALLADDQRAQSQYIADTNAEMAALADRYNEITQELADQENRETQLAVMQGIRTQRENEIADAVARGEAARARDAALTQLAAEQAERIERAIRAIDGSVAAVSIRFQAQFEGFTGAAAEWAGRIGDTMRSIAEGGSPIFTSPRPRKAPPLIDESPLSGGAGGGGGGAAKERDALADLIAEQERQIAALRDTDPVQREILKNHEALANATDAEREKVEGLITERLRLEQVRDRLQEIEQAGKSAFTGLITGSMSFSDALSNVLMKLAEMAASDAWDILWGGGGGWAGLGGLISGWLGGGTDAPKLAGGGKVFGPGGPTDDAVAAWLSNGEFVMNAAATAANQPILEALNAGVPISSLIHWIGGQHLAAMASGGFVGDSTGSSAPSGWRMGGGRMGSDQGGFGRMQLDIAVVTRYDGKRGEFRAEVEEITRRVSAETTAEGLEIFSSQHLPDRIAEIDANPRVRG